MKVKKEDGRGRKVKMVQERRHMGKGRPSWERRHLRWEEGQLWLGIPWRISIGIKF